MPKVLPFRRKQEAVQQERLRLREAVQLVLSDFTTLRNETRDELLQACEKRDGDLRAEQAQWPFVMMSRVNVPEAVKLIQGAPRPDATLRLFFIVLAHGEMNTGELQASRKQLGEQAFLQPDEVSRGLNTLKRLNLLRDEGEGRAKQWFINPYVAWAGSLAKRETEARGWTPRLIPVEKRPSLD